MWKLFTLIISLETLVDLLNKHTSKCIINSQKHILELLIFHHISSGFLLYGWLFNNKILLSLHIITVLVTAIHWITNNNKCALTVYINNECDWPENKPFHDILDMIGLKQIKSWNELWHYVFIILGMFISVYKLYMSK